MYFTRKIGCQFVFIAAMFLLSSCDRDKPQQELDAYLASLKAESLATSEKNSDTVKLINAKPPIPVKYNSGARRSPFEVLEAAPPAKGTTSTNPLQAYPLDMLRFVGTVSQDGKSMAFISAPDNRIYHINVGDVIGDHDSKVITIESDRVSLMEEYSEDGSTSMKRVVTLQLKEASQ